MSGRRALSAVALIDKAAKYSGILAWMRRRCVNGITILMYHKVLPENLAAAYPLRNLVVETTLFERQMALLAETFTVMTVSEATAAADRKGGRPVACITFDDGYRDNAEWAAPILEKHGLRGTFFVTSGFVDGSPMWFDRAALAWSRDPALAVRQASAAAPDQRDALAAAASLGDWMGTLKQLPDTLRRTVADALAEPAPDAGGIFAPMTPQQIRQLADKGHEIAGHSVTHPILTMLDDEALRREMEQCRSALSGWTEKTVDGFCYPNGNFDARVVAAAQAAGYRYACTVRRGLAGAGEDAMALSRRAILSAGRGETAETFEAEVVGWHDLLRQGRRAAAFQSIWPSRR